MRVGLHPVAYPEGDPRALGPLLRRAATTAEAVGCSHLLLMDHWLQLPFLGEVEDPMLEGYTTCGFLAAVTETIELGLLVTGVTYRRPALLVKTVTTLDVLSAGRAVLGIGAAWYEREHAAYGVPFPAAPERLTQLEDTLAIAHRMWSDDDGPFDGAIHHLAATVCSPPPVRRPRPPIIVGGGGERRTLRLVARYADASNLIASGHDEVARKLRILDQHCNEVGRDPGEIERTLLIPDDPLDDVAATVDVLEGYAAMGVTTVFLVPPPAVDLVGFIERVGETLIPAVADD